MRGTWYVAELVTDLTDVSDVYCRNSPLGSQNGLNITVIRLQARAGVSGKLDS